MNSSAAPHHNAIPAPPSIEILHLDGCPHTAATVELARSTAARIVPGAEVRDVLLDEASFRKRQVPGSPTVLVDGRDIAGREESPGGLIA